MKVIVQTAALQEALNLAGGIVATRTPKPILQCVKLVAADDTLTLLATDLEAGARRQVTAVQVETPGEALLPADRLGGIIRECNEESVTIETDNDTCHIRAAGSHFKIFGYDPGEYPAIAEFDGEADFSIDTVQIAKMIGKTLFATAKAHSHYAISGVLWEASDKNLQMVATDGHRLAMVKGSLDKAASKDVTAVVPAKLMGLIQRLAGEGEQSLDVQIDDNQILVRTANVVLVSSLVQGNFPKYSDVIPTETTNRATISSQEFQHRVRQAALLTNEESRGVRVAFESNKITLSSRAPETGEAEVTCEAKYDGAEMAIGFNPAFLIDAMRIIDTDEISFEMNASNKPAVIKTGSDFLYVIMPVSLE
ncbi:MAG: DNA polymerase III subunit beta [Phycisphaerales bacterium]|nr:DNA polymerase III subunit beta [Phycisphaerales bacterium]